MSSKSNITCHWYQKPTDTGIILYFCSCALLQHKINVTQGTVHSVSIARYNWLVFDQALEKKKICRTKNQFLEVWSSKLVNQTSEEIIRGAKCQLKTAPKDHQKSKTRSHDKPSIFYNTEAPYSKLCNQIEETMRLQMVFITQKLRSCPDSEIIFR